MGLFTLGAMHVCFAKHQVRIPCWIPLASEFNYSLLDGLLFDFATLPGQRLLQKGIWRCHVFADGPV